MKWFYLKEYRLKWHLFYLQWTKRLTASEHKLWILIDKSQIGDLIRSNTFKNRAGNKYNDFFEF